MRQTNRKEIFVLLMTTIILLHYKTSTHRYLPIQQNHTSYLQLLGRTQSEQTELKFRQLGDFTFNFNLAKSPCRKSRGSHPKSNRNEFQPTMKNIGLHTANIPDLSNHDT